MLIRGHDPAVFARFPHVSDASSALSSGGRIALVTYRGLPELNADDRLAPSAFEDLGLHAEAVGWDDAGADWLAFDAIILRSTWDCRRDFSMRASMS